MTSSRRCLLALTFVACWLAAPALGADTPHWVHHRLLDDRQALPKRLVVIPASVKVFETTAGGVEEEVPAWTQEASRNVLNALAARLPRVEGAPHQVPMPRLSAAESAVLEEHLALYKLVVATAQGTEFGHKVRRFDYGVGPGLAVLQQRSGADAALLVVGRDRASTVGRKATAVLGKIPFVGLLSGDAELGDSFMHVGVVDLRTGDLLWMNSDKRGIATNLRDPKDAQAMVDAIFAWYPAIEPYRQAYAK